MKSPIWHPYTQHAINPQSIHIDRAQGAYLYSGQRQIIDAISSWWVITHGHCHPKIVKAVQAQAAKCDQVIFAGFTHAPAEDLAEKLLAVVGDDLAHVFYTDSGSTAIEAALKMAIGYWEHTHDRKSKPRRKIIALEGGYHGDTFGTMSVGGRSVYHKIYEPYMFEVEHIPFSEKGAESKTFESLEKVLKENKDNIAAFIFEPLLQAAGGMRIYSAEALNMMADMCRAHGVLLIADEVMTGFGRTGTMFACDQTNFTPDIMCMSKGLTGGFMALGATLCSKNIYDAFYTQDKSKMFFHSSSFMGNPLACAAAGASLDIWKSQNVQANIDLIAATHAKAANDLTQHDNITNIRQIGTMLAMDIIVEDGGYLSDIQPKLYEYFLSQNTLLRPLGNTIYILPPYCVNKSDLGKIYNVINRALEEII